MRIESILLSILLSGIGLASSIAQTTSFTASTDVCLDENIQLTNSSTGAVNYIWDFCQEGLSNLTSVLEVSDLTEGQIIVGLEIRYDAGNWYGFVSSRDNSKVLRLDFGNDLNSSPSVVDLDNLGGVVNRPGGIRLFNESGLWYGILADFGNGHVIRMEFGNSLANVPSVVDLGDLSGWGSMYGIDIVQDGLNIFAVVSSQSNGIVSTINFGNSITNNPTALDVIDITDALIVTPIKVSVQSSGGQWYGLVSDLGSDKILRLNFGTDLVSGATVEELTSITNPAGLQFVKDGNRYYGFTINTSGSITRLDFGMDGGGPMTAVDLGNYGLLASTYGFSVMKEWPNWKGFMVGVSNQKLHKSEFTDNCIDVSQLSSSLLEPSEISFSESGNKVVELIGYAANGDIDTISQIVSVSSDTAPDMDFTTNNFCVDSPNIFIGNSSATITSWFWDFGDGLGTSNQQNPTYQYLATGTYSTTLTVTSDLGCTNSITKDVEIYNSPVALFMPPITNLCSNTALTFSNTSTLDFGSPVTWNWDFGDSNMSSDFEPTHTYSTGGMYTITLTATLPNGCTDEEIHMVTIDDGPSLDFSWTSNCWESSVGSDVEFINSSETVNVTYSWDFGDGSPIENSFEPAHLYTSAGDYDVILTVTSMSNGCISTLSKTIDITDQPLSDYNFVSTVENLPVQFIGLDLTNSLDEVTDWNWDFDGLGSSDIQNPEFTFTDPIDYQVSLLISTAQGCLETTTKTVSVSEASFPTTSFMLSSPVCQEENVQITNNSINADNYLWDFCQDGLENLTAVIEVSDLTEGQVVVGLEIEYEGGNWYGFVSSRDNGKILRLDYGIDLNNSPTVVDLGDLEGVVNSPGGIRLFEENGLWYGLLVDFNNGHLTRLEFGNTLQNVPLAIDLGDLSGWGSMYGVDIVQDGLNIVAVVSSQSNGIVSTINFGNSITNNPSALDVTDIVDALIVTPIKVSVQSSGGQWYGLVSDLGSDKILRLNFGTDLVSGATVEELTSITNPAGLQFVKDGNRYYGFTINTSGSITRLDFGMDGGGPITIVDLGDYGLLASTYGFSVIKEWPNWKGFMVGVSNQKLHKSEFTDDCADLSQLSSALFEPAEVRYVVSGTNVVELIAYSTNGNADIVSQSLTVTSDTAPDIDFTSNNSCIEGPNSFTSVSSSTLTSWSWDFGDQSPVSSEQSPSYQYSNTGTYTVRLTVEDGTCGNFIEKDIIIYNPPVASFTIPGGIICSNSPVSFTNTSIFDEGSPVTWEWNFGDQSAVSSEQSPNHEYANGGNYTVTLTATMPTCVDIFTQDVFIEEGPATDFTFNNSCDGDPVEFTDNTTSAAALLAWSWDFGDGSNSDLQNPTYFYANPGSYEVSLTTTNDIGCSTTLTQTVSNHANPVASFFNQLACSNTETFFFDQSSVEGANIIAWEWDFGDQSSIDSLQSPIHVYDEAGIYTVRLKVTSNFGCIDSVSQDIVVTESPTAAFTWDKSCLGEVTQFTDLSTPSPVSSITNWTWMIDGQIIEDQNPIYTFPGSGDYSVMLTVTAADFCLSTYVDTLSVNPLPNVSFGYTLACEDGPVSFYDTTETFNDNIVSREWIIGDEFVFLDDSVVTITPKVSGDYEVTLTVITANSCVSTITETVAISSLPSAGFETNTSLGSYPLTIDFTNTSKEASIYGWSFDEDTLQSTDQDPEHTFMEPGEYEVVLISQNDTGCSDTIIHVVNVVEPVMEALLNQIIPRSDNGRIELILDLQNNGSIALDESNLEFRISLGTEVQISESYQDVLYAQEKKNYTLNFDILEGTQERVPFLCVELITKDADFEDINLENNTACIDLEADPVFIDPFPNPTTDRVSVGIVIPEKDDIKIAWIDSNGKVFFRQTVTDTQAGYNVISFDAQIYGDGVYFVRVGYRGSEETFRVVVD